MPSHRSWSPLSVLAPLPPVRAAEAWDLYGRPLAAAFAPVVLMLLVACGMVWAINEHAAYKAELRRAESERYLAEFANEPVAGAWRRLSRTWTALLPRQAALLEKVNLAHGPGERTSFRAHRAFVLETVYVHDLGADVETVVRFFRRLSLCVRMGSCDPGLIAARFGDLPWRFRNQHYWYLAHAYPDENLDRSFRLLAPRSEHATARPEQAEAEAAAGPTG